MPTDSTKLARAKHSVASLSTRMSTDCFRETLSAPNHSLDCSGTDDPAPASTLTSAAGDAWGDATPYEIAAGLSSTCVRAWYISTTGALNPGMNAMGMQVNIVLGVTKVGEADLDST